MSTKGITSKEPDPRIVYADIIDHPHYQSSKRTPMSLYNRAAQFASFDALVGFGDMISEEARVTGSRVELSESEIAKLNEKLALISDVIADGYTPKITVKFFVPDKLKAGGSYEELTGNVKRVDAIEQQLVFYGTGGRTAGHKVELAAITELHGELVDYLDETL